MRFAILILSLSLASCSALDPDDVKECEQDLQSSLKSPSSYKRISFSAWNKDLPLDELQALYFDSELLPHQMQLLDDIRGKNVAVRHVGIEYDADNSYGAAIRETKYCNFVIADGAVYRPSPAYRAKFSQHIDDIAADRSTATVKNELYRDQPDAMAKDYDPFAALNDCCIR